MRRWALLAIPILALALAAGANWLAAPAWRQVASSGRGVIAVIYTGDGGWRGIDEDMARSLTDRGADVVGVDSLKYFSRPRTAVGAAADLATVLAKNPGRPVVLAGYSFGADALPLIVEHLSAPARARIARLVLIAPEPLGELAFHPGAWWGVHPTDAYAIAPVVARLALLPITCVYGRAEHGDACPDLPPEVSKIALPGGHHFGGDGRAVGMAVARAAGL